LIGFLECNAMIYIWIVFISIAVEVVVLYKSLRSFQEEQETDTSKSEIEEDPYTGKIALAVTDINTIGGQIVINGNYLFCYSSLECDEIITKGESVFVINRKVDEDAYIVTHTQEKEKP